MKKKLALLLSAIMVVCSLPMTAFATSSNAVDRIVTGTVDDVLAVDGEGSKKSPVLSMTEKDMNSDTTTSVTFKATLTNAEWAIDDVKTGILSTLTKNTSGGYSAGSVTILSSKQAIFTLDVEDARNGSSNRGVYLPLEVELTDEGDGNITIDPMESVLTAGTYKFANIVAGDTSSTIADTTKLIEAGAIIETITITETSAGSFESTKSGAPLKLRLTSGFEFVNVQPTVSIYDESEFSAPSCSTVMTKATAAADAKGSTGVQYSYSNDGQDLYLWFDVKTGGTSKAATFSITGLKVKYDEDDVAVGRECYVAISGAGTSKQSLLVGKATTYGVTWEAENKTLPVLYSGSADIDENETLEVTMKEVIKDSWLEGRKTTISFPDGIKVIDVEINKAENVVDGTAIFDIEDNEITISGTQKKTTETDGRIENKKATFEMVFTLSVAPDFEGDVVATLGGAGVEEDMDVTVATVVKPIKVEAEANEVSIDYRKVNISDITITEAFAGALEKDTVLQLELDKISFDGTPKIEVVEGDISIEKVSLANDDRNIQIEIKHASATEASTLKLSGVALYLERDIPAGTYPLKISAYSTVTDGGYSDYEVTLASEVSKGDVNEWDSNYDPDDAYFKNSVAKGEKHKGSIYFDKRSVTVVDDYVEVVTAGRDQDDSTFTTKITVQIGANTITAGKTTIQLDVPAYISNGYTMMPVRAVTEALSDVAIVNWNDATKTVTIQFGARIIKMTVGSNTMLINGVDVQMSAPCEITDSRAFIPLRDLGYALGLNDSKIAWDDATKTATLN